MLRPRFESIPNEQFFEAHNSNNLLSKIVFRSKVRSSTSVRYENITRKTERERDDVWTTQEKALKVASIIIKDGSKFGF